MRQLRLFAGGARDGVELGDDAAGVQQHAEARGREGEGRQQLDVDFAGQVTRARWTRNIAASSKVTTPGRLKIFSRMVHPQDNEGGERGLSPFDGGAAALTVNPRAVKKLQAPMLSHVNDFSTFPSSRAETTKGKIVQIQHLAFLSSAPHPGRCPFRRVRWEEIAKVLIFFQRQPEININAPSVGGFGRRPIIVPGLGPSFAPS